MPKARKLASREEFAPRFVRKLESYYRANATVTRILEDASIRDHCALLLYFCVNDAGDRLRGMTKDFRRNLKTKVADAIRGAGDIAFVYRHLSLKPHLAEYMSTVAADLREIQRTMNSAPASLDHGRNLDWSLVDDARNRLSESLRQQVSNATLAELLSAAYAAMGRTDKIDEDGVRHGLMRFRERKAGHRLQLISRNPPA